MVRVDNIVLHCQTLVEMVNVGICEKKEPSNITVMN